MVGLGLHCNIHQGRPRVVGVLIRRNAAGELKGAQEFSHLSDAQENFPLQLKNLASALESRLPMLGADGIVVRTMDYSPAIKRQQLAQHSMVAGVLVASSRRHCDLTRTLTGRDIGSTLGSSKAAAEAQAANLVGDALREAGAAALAALSLA